MRALFIWSVWDEPGLDDSAGSRRVGASSLCGSSVVVLLLTLFRGDQGTPTGQLHGRFGAGTAGYDRHRARRCGAGADRHHGQRRPSRLAGMAVPSAIGLEKSRTGQPRSTASLRSDLVGVHGAADGRRR